MPSFAWFPRPVKTSVTLTPGRAVVQEVLRQADICHKPIDFRLPGASRLNHGRRPRKTEYLLRQIQKRCAFAAPDVERLPAERHSLHAYKGIHHVADPYEIEDLVLAVDHQRQAVQRVGQEQWDDALGVAGAVDIRQPEDLDIHS